MSDKVFVDTNVLIYAHDVDAGPKRTIAARRLQELWATRQGLLSVQVLEEFYVNVTRKISAPLTPTNAREIIRAYCAWDVEEVRPGTILRGSEIAERHRLSFWDALIVAAARQGHATMVLSEDLNPGQRIDGIVIENPFLPVPRPEQPTTSRSRRRRSA